MAIARSLVFTAAGADQEAKDADTQVTSGTIANASGSLTVNAAATSLIVQIGSVTKLTVSATAVTVGAGVAFTGDGSGLTALNGANITAGTIAETALDTATQYKLSPSGVSNGRIFYDNGTRVTALPFVANAILVTNGTTLSYVNTLPATSGGTGIASFTTAGELLYSNSTTGLSTLLAGTSGYLLKCNGTAAPSWLDKVPVANGGTGAATLTVHGVLLGNTTSAVNVSSAGTAGQVFTSGGAGADGAYADTITATSSESVLGSGFAITGGDGVFQDTGLSVTLPSAGTYIVSAEVRGDLLLASGGAYIRAYFYNSTDAAIVANTTTVCTYAGVAGQYFFATTPMSIRITVAAGKTIKLYASQNGVASYTVCNISSDTTGYTRMRYVKIAPA